MMLSSVGPTKTQWGKHTTISLKYGNARAGKEWFRDNVDYDRKTKHREENR